VEQQPVEQQSAQQQSAQDVTAQVEATARRAGAAARVLARLTRATKDAALVAGADALEAATAQLLAANDVDVARAEAAGTPAGTVDRLRLTRERVAACAAGLRTVAGLPDPVGEVLRASTRPNGLQLRQLRVPMGVIGMVYEARPNVTVDAAGLCVKAGSAALLRGSSSARDSNAALADVLREAFAGAGVPADAVQLVPGDTHESVKALMRARGLVDLLIPRGGAGLIRQVVTESLVPVIETGVGVCHLYVDSDADLEMALAILLDAKTTRPSVCNSLETLLVHEAIAPAFLPAALTALCAAGVTVHGDPAVLAHDPLGRHGVLPATDEDWAAEYLSLALAARVVPDLDAALEHVRRWGSGHSEAVVTDSLATATRWTTEVDAAAVLVNASTRFTDGEEFGFGAEIGISTQKLHARGPMGLPELTTTRWVVTGSGQVRG